MVPFIEVLLHTFMDCMREEDDREINHHGRSVNVGSGEETEEESGQARRIFVVSANSSHSEEDKRVANLLGLYLLTCWF